MKTYEDVQRLEKLIGQLDGLHSEVITLAKKSPNDGVNKFKLKLINTVLENANSLIGKEYQPFDDFDIFDPDDVPTNSDVTLILTQYVEAVERFRSAHVTYKDYSWVYWLNGQPSKYPAGARKQVGK